MRRHVRRARAGACVHTQIGLYYLARRWALSIQINKRRRRRTGGVPRYHRQSVQIEAQLTRPATRVGRRQRQRWQARG